MTLTPITTLTTITTKTEDMKASTTFAFDFNSYNYFNYYNYRNRGSESKHYVAIVPADLRSAGIEYQDLLIRLLPICYYIM